MNIEKTVKEYLYARDEAETPEEKDALEAKIIEAIEDYVDDQKQNSYYDGYESGYDSHDLD